MQRESDKLLEQLISHFFSKSLHLIVSSRVPSIHSLNSNGLSTNSRTKKIDKWFHLLLGDPPPSLQNPNYWRINLMDPMVIDIVLLHKGTNPSTKTVLERWIVQYEYSQRGSGGNNNNNSCDCRKVYHKSILLFRSLYSHMRLLPVHRVLRRLSRSSDSFNFDITYDVSSFSDLFSRGEEEMMEEFNFTSVDAFQGRLCISVIYRTSLSDLNLDFSTPLSQNNRSMVSLYLSHSREKKGVCDNSFPLRGLLRPMPSVAVDNSFLLSHSYFTETETVKGSRNFSLEFSCSCGNSPPLLSPRSTEDDKSLKKTEAHRDGGVLSRTKSYGFQKIVRDNKDDSGRFSGFSSLRSSQRIRLSRSSSKSSFRDDFDDWDFSCPFDVDMLGVQHSQKMDYKDASEITSKALPMVRKSQDAAIGVLVRMLKAAPPLHHEDPSCVPSQSLKTNTKEPVSPAFGIPVLRKTADALEELRSYIKIRDLLLSKREIGFMNKHEA